MSLPDDFTPQKVEVSKLKRYNDFFVIKQEC